MMSNKPRLVDVLEMLKMKATAAALYDEIDRRAAEMLAEFGEGRFDYDLEQGRKESYHPFVDDMLTNGRYLKFELEDNVRKLKDGEPVWKSVGMKRVSFSSMSLKRCPESLSR